MMAGFYFQSVTLTNGFTCFTLSYYFYIKDKYVKKDINPIRVGVLRTRITWLSLEDPDSFLLSLNIPIEAFKVIQVLRQHETA